MRLLKASNTGELSLTEEFIEKIPDYAILSHTWGADGDEVTFSDLKDGSWKSKAGRKKIQFCGRQARKDELRFFWVDTCCIDKTNNVELSEAITSMFRWYRNAAKCYAYLTDVSTLESHNEGHNRCTWESAFRKSRWFRRGWTLQELLAPKSVEFFSREEELLGDKKLLEQQLHEITGIPTRALHGGPLSDFSIGERMRWAANRNTRKIEDKAYCLLGIFDVSMSLRYGEGEKAFIRLENKVNGSSKYGEVITWLAPVNPEEFQVRVLASRHPGSGLSFAAGPLLSWLRHETNRNSLMWITGKSGSGKSTLFSFAVEEIKSFVSKTPATFLAYHYCAFSDPDSQQLINMLGSFAVQMSAWQPQILEDLQQKFESDKARKRGKSLQIWELEQVLVKYIAMFSSALILVDALDESKDFFGNLNCILSLLQQLPNLKVMVTSTRKASAAGMNRWPNVVEVDMQPDEDIRSFVEARLSDHDALCHLSSGCKEKIRSELIGNADQSFRWVCLILDNLCKQRTGRAVMSALNQLPQGLNGTYASMLGRIPASDRSIAREALLWLSFAKKPMTLIELSEAVVLEDGDTTLNQDSRLHDPEIILEICHGFVDHDADNGKMKLAHSSVREYLVSEYPKSDGSSFFSFEADLANQQLMQKCLTYLMFDDFRSGVAPTLAGVVSRQRKFPLLEYAARYWGLHASFATTNDWVLAEKLFSTRALPRGGNYGAWLGNCYYSALAAEFSVNYYEPSFLMNAEPLYNAASFGMAPIVQRLLSDSASIDLEHPGGRFGSTALQVACFRGRKEIAKTLLAAGANFWSEDPGSGQPAYYWAQVNDWTDLVAYMTQLRPEIAARRPLSQGMKRWGKEFQGHDWQKR